MFNVGQLVWVWIKGEEPSTALVVEDLEGGFYNVLFEEQIHKLSDDYIWTKKDDCVKPPPVFPHIRRLFPGLIANQMITVQPMSVPSALPFYLDYTYNSGSKDEEDK
jgi:hypothetical protein